MEEKKVAIGEKAETATADKQKPKRKFSKAWEAAQRFKGRVIVRNQSLYYR